MPIHRIICRWDFGLSPKLMDQPGGLLDELDLGGRWEKVNESSSKRQFTLRGLNGDGSIHETFAFSPVLAVFSAEWVEGVEITKLTEHRQVADLFRYLDVVKRYGGIRTLRRCGLRVTHLAQVAPELANNDSEEQVLLARILERSASRIATSMQDVVGRATDASVKLVGSHEDGTNYTISYGPFNDVEKPKWFPEISDAWSSPTGADFLCDADFWESDFELTVASRKWAAPLLARFNNLILRVTDELKENGNGLDRIG